MRPQTEAMTATQINMRAIDSRPSGAFQKAVKALAELEMAEDIGAVRRAYLTVRAPRSLEEWKDRGPYEESKTHACLYLLAGQECPNGPQDYRELTPALCLPPHADLDRTTMWDKDGKPSVIVTQPYSISDFSTEEIGGLCRGLRLQAEAWNEYTWCYPAGVLALVITRKDDREHSHGWWEHRRR